MDSSEIFQKAKGTDRGKMVERFIEHSEKLNKILKWPIENNTLLGIGSQGIVFSSIKNGQDVAVKLIELEKEDHIAIYKHEVASQKMFLPFSPKIFDDGIIKISTKLSYGVIIMEVLGDELDKYLMRKRSKVELKSVESDLVTIFKFMLESRLTHGDMALFNIAKRKSDGHFILLDFDSASDRFFQPEVDIYRMQSEIYNPKENPSLKEMDKSNLKFLLRHVPNWSKMMGIKKVNNKFSENYWRYNYQEYCKKVKEVQCLPDNLKIDIFRNEINKRKIIDKKEEGIFKNQKDNNNIDHNKKYIDYNKLHGIMEE
jgi:hypothetical protein